MTVQEFLDMVKDVGDKTMELRFVDSQNGNVMVPVTVSTTTDLSNSESAGTKHIRIELSS